MIRDRLSRNEALLYAAYCGLLSIFTKAYWPVRVKNARFQFCIFAFAAALLLINAFFPDFSIGKIRLPARARLEARWKAPGFSLPFPPLTFMPGTFLISYAVLHLLLTIHSGAGRYAYAAAVAAALVISLAETPLMEFSKGRGRLEILWPLLIAGVRTAAVFDAYCWMKLGKALHFRIALLILVLGAGAGWRYFLKRNEGNQKLSAVLSYVNSIVFITILIMLLMISGGMDNHKFFMVAALFVFCACQVKNSVMKMKDASWREFAGRKPAAAFIASGPALCVLCILAGLSVPWYLCALLAAVAVCVALIHWEEGNEAAPGIRGPRFLQFAVWTLIFCGSHAALWSCFSKESRFHLALFLSLSFLYVSWDSLARMTYEVRKHAVIAISFCMLIVFCFLLAGLLAWMQIVSLGTLALISIPLAVAIPVAEVSVLLFFAAVFRRRAVQFAAGRAVILSLMFCNAFLLVPLCFFLWQRPPRAECIVPIQVGEVKLVSPASLTAGFSYPYDLIYIPEKQAVAASFKMAGNLMLFFWDRPEANKVVLIDTSGYNRRAKVVDLPGGKLAECLAWNPSGQKLMVTQVGFGENSLSEIDMSRYPGVSLLRTRPLNFEPNGIFAQETGGSYMVIGIERQIAFLNAGALKEIRRMTLPVSAFSIVFQAVARPESGLAYFSSLGRNVLELNVNTGRARRARVGFGGGNMAIVEQTSSLYQTDSLFGRLNEIDLSTMKARRSISFDYKPRPVIADYRRGVLIIGDWFNGYIHTYRLLDLKETGRPIRTGRYLRDFAYDEENGRLFCACKCGIYMVNIGKLRGLPSQ